jgi:hypothetical protein
MAERIKKAVARYASAVHEQRANPRDEFIAHKVTMAYRELQLARAHAAMRRVLAYIGDLTNEERLTLAVPLILSATKDTEL